MPMKISNIPDSVYISALKDLGIKFKVPAENPDWTPKDEYECVSQARMWLAGELEKAIYEHMTTEGWEQA